MLALIRYLCIANARAHPLVISVIIGTIVGAVLGIAVQIIAGFPDDPSKVVYIKESTKWFSLVGGGSLI